MKVYATAKSYWLLLVILITGSIFYWIYSTNNGSLSFDNFPLEKHWSTNLNENIETVSSNGSEAIFIRTRRKLFVLDARSGKVLWRHPIAWQGDPKAPIELNGTIYFADGERIWAFNELNGEIKWSKEVSIPSAYVDFVSAKVVVAALASYIYVMDTSDGTVLWSKADCRYYGIQTFVDELYVYSACKDGITVMDLYTGKVAWVVNEPFPISKIAFQNGIMYFLSGQDTLSAMDLRERNIVWDAKINIDGFRTIKVLEDYVSVTGSTQLCIFGKRNGLLIFCMNLAEPQNPTLIEDTLFVFNAYQNNITGIDLLSGNKIGALSIKDNRIFATQKELMLTLDKYLIFANRSRLYSFEAK